MRNAHIIREFSIRLASMQSVLTGRLITPAEAQVLTEALQRVQEDIAKKTRHPDPVKETTKKIKKPEGEVPSGRPAEGDA